MPRSNGVPTNCSRLGCRTLDGRLGARPYVIHVLATREQLEVLDGARRPAGGVARHLLEDRRGALPTSVGDRVRHLGARRETGDRRAGQSSQPDELGKVRQHPGRRGLDEQVVVELVDPVGGDREFVGEDLEILSQHLAACDVALAVQRGQELVELVDRDAHQSTSSATPSTGSVRISAPGASGGPPGTGAAATRNVPRCTGSSSRCSRSTWTASTPVTPWIVCTISLSETPSPNVRCVERVALEQSCRDGGANDVGVVVRIDPQGREERESGRLEVAQLQSDPAVARRHDRRT